MSLSWALSVRTIARHTCRMSLGMLAVAAALVVFGPVPASAQVPANLAAQINLHLMAGEFGPAKAIAAGMADPAARNAMFRDIAMAQARLGARSASLNTVNGITNGMGRSQAFGAIGGMPFGGGAMADFTELTDLITSTIAPTSWEDAGGAGAIDDFPGGVYVDPSGLLKKMVLDGGSRSLAAIRKEAATAGTNINARQKSPLRKVSLVRLEQQIQALRAMGREPSEAMSTLAGLQSIKYVLVYPESGDIVLAGPAGDWKLNDEDRLVSAETNQPVMRLDDFVVVLRSAYSPDGRFGCSITPTKDNLAKTKAFLVESSKNPLKPGAAARDKWLKELQSTLGHQDIEVYGIDPRTRTARILVEADYRMKLVGMGLEDGVPGVVSYLNSIKIGKDGAVPPMDVLRWWFTLNYDAIVATEPHNAFELKGQGVKVLSENELLTERGERVHTGKSDELNAEFAHSFTKHFAELSTKYPIYAELKNIFDLALVAALLKSEDLPNQVGWQMAHFAPSQDSGVPAFEVELGVAPAKVETVINHRIVNGKQIVAGISGGVTVEPRKLIQPKFIKTDTYGAMKADRAGSAPKNLPVNAWWWD